MAESLIEVKNLIKSFDGRVVLDGINLCVERGSVFAIMGGSGCGKTTLLRHLIGVIRPDCGQILVGRPRHNHVRRKPDGRVSQAIWNAVPDGRAAKLSERS